MWTCRTKETAKQIFGMRLPKMFVAVSNPLHVVAGDFPVERSLGIQRPCDAVVIEIRFLAVKVNHRFRDR
jgi:hypothetical protein